MERKLLKIFGFLFLLFSYNGVFANPDASNIEYTIRNITTDTTSSSSLTGTVNDEFEIYIKGDLNANDIGVRYQISNDTNIDEFNHGSIDLYEESEIVSENIGDYTFGNDFTVKTTKDTDSYGDKTYEMYMLYFKIPAGTCGDISDITIGASWSDEDGADLKQDITLQFDDIPECEEDDGGGTSSGSVDGTDIIYVSNPQIFKDLNLDTFDYPTNIKVLEYEDGSGAIREYETIDYTKQLSDITKLIYQSIIVILLFIIFVLMWIFYTFINDLLGKK